MTASTEEKYLNLPHSRVLAYSNSGNTRSSTLVIFFHGVFGIGDARDPQPSLVQRDVHFVAPTLLGWGNSSPRATSTPYHLQLASDITALIDELYPINQDDLKLYVAGGSYGTVAAQMLYGASLDIFPPGKYLRGCLTLAVLSPPLYHKGYTEGLSSQSYVSIGPPSRWLPWNMLQRLAVPVIKGKLSSQESAEAYLRSIIFDKMDDEEKALFKKWREEYGREEGEFETKMARNMMKSIEKTWNGFIEVSDVIHSDWGFNPSKFIPQNNAPIVLVCSKGDQMAPEAMSKWLDSQYSNSRLITISGGHLAGLYELDRLWAELLDSTVIA